MQKLIIISNYNAFSGDKSPTINAKGFLNRILLTNCSYVNVIGINIIAKEGVIKNITVNNLVIKEVFYERPNFQRGVAEVKTANGL
jgi:hypothetical protein